jgi:hypothetical protein
MTKGEDYVQQPAFLRTRQDWPAGSQYRRVNPRQQRSPQNAAESFKRCAERARDVQQSLTPLFSNGAYRCSETWLPFCAFVARLHPFFGSLPTVS